MNNEIKETLEYKIDFLTKSLNIGIPTKNRRYFNDIKDYITNLQQVNKNQAKRNSRQRLANQKQQELILKLQQENEKLSDKIEFYEDVDSDRCAYNEELQKENERLKEKLEARRKICLEAVKREQDYKSRCEKANNQLKIIMQIIKEQPTRNVEDDEWIENRLIGVVNILQNGSEKNE